MPFLDLPDDNYIDNDDPHEGYVTEQRAQELFTAGLQAMREMLARFVENGPPTDPKLLAQSMRANWNPSWGDDPGRPDEVVRDCWDA